MRKIQFDRKWTLFLDRDGVVNNRMPGRYIDSWEEFNFLPGVLSSLAKAASVFGRIVIVTNQQGIGRGIVSSDEVAEIHRKMISEIQQNGGRIDAIYVCPDIEGANSVNRKPETGMALQAKRDFPEIIFHQSVIVGDSPSDMEFGRKSGMMTIFVGNRKDELIKNDSVDHFFKDLEEFCNQYE